MWFCGYYERGEEEGRERERERERGVLICSGLLTLRHEVYSPPWWLCVDITPARDQAGGLWGVGEWWPVVSGEW